MRALTAGILLILLRGGAPTPPPTIVTPVLSFPDPALDDTASYQGYRTRFYRDSRQNALQIYVDGRSGRVVHLWADALDESIGFTVRDSAGAPARTSWPGDAAIVGDSANGSTRWLEYGFATDAPRLDIGAFLLGSMRVERDLQYARGHLQPFAPGRVFPIAELDSLLARVERLDPPERRRELALLRARDVAELRARLVPRVTMRAGMARIVQPSFDGANTLALELRVDTALATLQESLGGGSITARRRGRGPYVVRVRILTDGQPLTPLSRQEIFSAPFLRWLDSLRSARPTSPTPTLAGGATWAPPAVQYPWVERQVRGAELLASREKLMAGLPNFATYFGRDGMMTALVMRDVWTPEMTEHEVASVLRKLSPDGRVSHEEALGGQAVRENAAEYSRVVDAYLHARAARAGNSDSLLARARDLVGHLQRVRENYSMLDDKFQLPVLAGRWLGDTSVSQQHKRAFLLETDDGESRLSRLTRALEVMAQLTAAYARDPIVTNLVAFSPLDDGRWRSASWRDSGAGYAGGRYPMDINVIWAPEALRSMESIVAELRTLGLVRGDSIVGARAGPVTRSYLRYPASLRHAALEWSGSARHFAVQLTADELRRRVAAKLDWLPADERRYWEKGPGPTAPSEPLSFVALSLDDAGHPIGVVNTDPATHLFLANLTADVLAGRIRADSVTREIAPFLRPFPAGLFVEGLGPLAANDTYASRDTWDRFRDDSYHGPRVVWGREVNLLLAGLAKQVAAAYDDRGRLRDRALGPYVTQLEQAIRQISAAVDASGLEHLELWSYRIDGDRLAPARYGFSSDVQLWNTASLAVQFELSGLGGR